MWKQITGFDYEISEFGEIRSIKFGRLLVVSSDKDGYAQTGLRQKGDRKKCWFRIHRLVAFTFCNPPPDYTNLDVDHIDRNPSNNHFSNLRWTTRTENNANRKNTCWQTNKTTGELYITKYKNGYMLRVNKSTLKHRSWHKTLEDAVNMRTSII